MARWSEGRHRLTDVGLFAWTALGIVGLLYVAYLVLSGLSLVVVPVVLALFAAAALEPLTRILHLAHVPRPLAALLSLLVAVAVIGGVFAFIVPAFVAQVPGLVGSVQRAIGQLDDLLRGLPAQNLDVATLASGLFGGGATGSGAVTAALGTSVRVLTGLALLVVVTFFYLLEGRSLVSRVVGRLPPARRQAALDVADRIWDSVGRFFRGLLLVALIDAVGIGLGLFLLGVPLAFPLAVLVYLGAFIPVAGAFVSGLLAVLVAFAERGLFIALCALGVVVAVQQLEGNVLQPLVMGRVIRLPAFVILIAVAIGATWLGVLGAFLATPVAASIARILEYVDERRTRPKSA